MSGGIAKTSSKLPALNRMFGPYAPAYRVLIICNVVVTEALWFKHIRTSP